MPSPRNKLLFGFVTLAIMAVIGLGLLEVILRITADHRGNATFLLGKRWYYLTPIGVPDEMPDVTADSDAYRSYDPDLGWAIQPLGVGDDPHREGDAASIYFANEFGYRCTEAEHRLAESSWLDKAPPSADPNHYDFVCIGDSFTHGDCVVAEDSWPFALSRLSGKSVANLGVGGYGIDQAIMRYEIKNPKCNQVLLGLIAGDLERATQLIYNLTFGDTKSKPIYEFSDENAVTIFNRPAVHGAQLLTEYERGSDSEFFKRAKYSWDPRLMRRGFTDISYCARVLKSIPVWKEDRSCPPIYQEDGERLSYCLLMISHLSDLCKTRGAGLSVVLLGEINSFRSNPASTSDNWALLKSKLDELGIHWIDAAAPVEAQFVQDRSTVLNSYDGVHYSPEANATVASTVAQALASR